MRLPGMGAARLAEIQAAAPDWPGGWLARLPPPAASALRLWLDHPARSPLTQGIEADLAWLAAAPDRHLLYPGHPAWPALLEQIGDPPPVLWALGDLAALQPPRLAIVGSRRPTREGLANAAAFGRELASRDWCVVSGLALGVDGAAQQAALEAGGRSVAVLGCGVDVIYPPRHGRLYQQLLDHGGLILSEHPPGTPARPAFFPRRNRIVTGLSLGVLVVEAAEKSGSLVSARLAIEQNREVFALPGSIHNPQARGCLRLIRQGAVLVRHVEDILAELTQWAASSLALARPREAGAQGAASSGDPLLRWLSDAPSPLDALVSLTGLSVPDCQRRLLELELEGRAAQAPGGWVRLPENA
ncbi:DNA-protecting protein DprA [Halomonas sp. MCCC 1A17488]|uniref:DNA-protecting protein DprA n=1 Tax=Billgrantia sulfidoxydans TaxID=2733484 RepID=A0ABX7WA10_9GAMM|nr:MULTISPECIES: DNA-processing protein DprA [Halomonas]MCE8017839.1 DNA-protecting protein DprA [Halomonas sp. MCCC 1A17488]MCG3241172.1 DNA-protecting protein DprA [Halomonas sp. MCCC 1A17488]QPP51700.1 DNA-protecting protein DprA [Halomonas sp. SS10-MC5]QTP57186.1 DNA-protecting protein DprA [Halomonas sulfidoxydans]